jgi:hypothetical protein
MLQRPPHEAEGTLPCKAPSLAFIGNYLPVTIGSFRARPKDASSGLESLFPTMRE